MIGADARDRAEPGRGRHLRRHQARLRPHGGCAPHGGQRVRADARASAALGCWRLTATPVASGSTGARGGAISARCHWSWRPAQKHCRDEHGSPTRSRVRPCPTRCWRAQRPSRQAPLGASGRGPWGLRLSSIPRPPTRRVPVRRWRPDASSRLPRATSRPLSSSERRIRSAVLLCQRRPSRKSGVYAPARPLDCRHLSGMALSLDI